MAKMKLLGLFFLFFNFLIANVTPLLATNKLENHLVEQCDLPAPDSFRITEVGGDFINLAWKPIFPGAVHQLIVMESDGAGGYVTILVENQVTGDTYTADNLLPGTGYRFVMATKCTSGDPSEVKTIFDGITLIVDLVISGRKPVNPNPVSNCDFIPTSFNWAGFNIKSPNGDFQVDNFFELKRQVLGTSNNFEIRTHVARYSLDGDLFAVNDDGLWPKCYQPIIPLQDNRFRVDKQLSNGAIERIGYVDIFYKPITASYYVCPDYLDPDLPWNLNYEFMPIIAHKVAPPEDCASPRPSRETFSDCLTFKFDNPFNINLKVWQESPDLLTSGIISLYSITGELIFLEPFDGNNTSFNFPTNDLISGVYILVIESTLGVRVEKLIKTKND